ncbi:MAG: CotH kinase family protein [Ignavibacteria bacterium]|nr:CotH kinase family protein [Ignavibacteria bacterium]
MTKFFRSLFLTCILTTLVGNNSFAQSKADESWKLFDDSTVARVDITVTEAAIAYMYQNVQSDSLHYCMVRFRNHLIDETLDSVGITLRGNTSRNSQKKSFKLSFNAFLPGRDFYNLDKMNLNGEHNDPSIIRSKLCWDLFNDVGIPHSRAAHADVYINGKYYGLYINVEHVDDKFLKKNFSDSNGNLWKCLYPADLVYLGEDQNLYKKINGGIQTYDLKTNETADDYSKLAHLISIVNKTSLSVLPDSLEKVIDISGLIKLFAFNTLVASWDDYRSLNNNYYLYHEPSKDKFTILPYDYDNTFAVDWFNTDWATADPYNYPKAVKGSRPLWDRLISIKQYKNLYTHFLEFYNNKAFKLSLWDNRLENLRIKITASALADSFRTLDYNFTFSDFLNSYSSAHYENQHVKKGLREYVNLRSTSLSTKLNYASGEKPIVYEYDWYPKNPAPNDTIYVIASAFSQAGLNSIQVEYHDNVTLSTTTFPLVFSPVPNTKKVEEADRWRAALPPLGANITGKFRITAKDVNQLQMSFPRGAWIEIKTPQAETAHVVINEFLAKNTVTNTDSTGQFEDWIELYNPTDKTISLDGCFLSDSRDSLMRWTFPTGISIAPLNYLLVWCDNDLDQAGLHTNFKLSADGEFIALTSPDGVTILDSISFGTQYADTSFGRLPDGESTWTFLKPTPGQKNLLTSIQREQLVPEAFTVAAFPNPFNSTSTIRFTLPSSGKVKIVFYNLLGEQLYTYEKEFSSPGSYDFKWNGRDANGKEMSSGIYLCTVESAKNFKSLKLVLMK